MLVDEAKIIIKAGHGGAGRVSFAHSVTRKGGPDGGNGGRGGDVYIKGTSDLSALRQFTFTKTLAAENGGAGGSNKKFGADGKDIEILMPVGTLLIDEEKGKRWEVTEPDQRFLIAKGGLGGKGNFEFRSSRNTTPMYAQPGLPGEEYHLSVTLRLIAEFGLIGLPNAGKSSLLNELTKANVKVANYPFTTLEPNLGTFEGSIIADIPGLIEGASAGKGLGIKFLKHIEKVGLLLHCITSESDDVMRDYQTVRKELEQFNPELLEKEELVVLTKTDLLSTQELKKKMTELKKTRKKVFSVSIHDWDSLETFKSVLRSLKK